MGNYKEIVMKQRAFFRTGRSKSLPFRKLQIKRIHQWICRHEKLIMSGLVQDLGKSSFESYATEIGIVKEEIRHTLKNLDKWAAVQRVRTPITQFPALSFIYPEPYGVTLIMSPWNYPFQLTMAPLIGALSAGNCVVVKPSAYSPNTSMVIKRMMDDLFPTDYVTVIEGGRSENQALLDEHFDYIFFTGGASVGKLVMEKASHHLTPVSLELGGKSPCIVDETADLKMAARRIVWGKLLNAGQTCVAPDYIMVHKSVKDKLVRYMIKAIQKMYGTDPCNNSEYPAIINEKHIARLSGLLQEVRILSGGTVKRKERRIAPTIVDQVSWESPVMKEEIFGPILPILTFYDINEVISSVNAGPKPLALYLFTRDKHREKQVLKSILFGGGCINDTVVHVGTPYLPFGGVGSSGMGAYHGKAGFDTFTHKKGMMKKSLVIDVPFRYAPFKDKLKILRKIQR